MPLPATVNKPLSRMSECEFRAELAHWDALERSGELATLMAQRPADPQPKSPSVKAIDCGRSSSHPTPLTDRELSDVEREAAQVGLATIAGELGLAVGINWYATWDGARVNGKSVEGFTCPCTPDRVWVRAGVRFWDAVDTIVHEGRHLDQTERGVTLTREEREADARQWAAKTVEWLKSEGF